MSINPVVYVSDAGSVSQGNFAWLCSRQLTNGSADPLELAQAIATDINAGTPVALGFESPLFVPCPEDALELGHARQGEITEETGNRPFNAGAGASIAMTGLQILAWLLRKVKALCPDARATTRWSEFVSGGAELFIWEAFVSGSEKGADHCEDAALAIDAFQRSVPDLEQATRIPGDKPASIAGAMVLWAGLSTDLALLHHPCVVLRPIFDPTIAAYRLQKWKAECAAKKASNAAKRRQRALGGG